MSPNYWNRAREKCSLMAMVRVQLAIADPANRITLKTILEAEGYRIVEGQADALIADDPVRAEEQAALLPTLVLTAAAGIPRAVAAMRKGVYGYVYVPFQPGEAGMMVQRALARNVPEPEAPLTRLDEAEAAHIERVLRACGNNRVRAAQVLGIGRNTLWRKMKHIQERGRQ
ncbi:MAG: 8 protein [Candidatus Hydrogenedentes bacterium]|nr:8 protein [Candidatus Hydrogenedentota bacterium]